MALSNRAACHEDDWDWFDMADAVIDALSSMTITEAMCDAYSEKAGGEWIDANGWRAMVGAMRDE